MYPAGTWVKGSIDVINVDAVYDSTGLEQNVYTALFVEEGILAVQRCTHTCAVNIPVCVSGAPPPTTSPSASPLPAPPPRRDALRSKPAPRKGGESMAEMIAGARNCIELPTPNRSAAACCRSPASSTSPTPTP